MRLGLTAALTGSDRGLAVDAVGPESLVALLTTAAYDVVVVGVRGRAPERFDAVVATSGTHRVPCLVLLDRFDEPELRAASLAGAATSLPVTVDVETLGAAVTALLAGVAPADVDPTALGPGPSTRPSAAVGMPAPEPARPLRPVELDVLRLAAEGWTNEAIAAELGIAARTVKTHVQNLLVRLDAPDRTAAVARAFRLGILR